MDFYYLFTVEKNLCQAIGNLQTGITIMLPIRMYINKNLGFPNFCPEKSIKHPNFDISVPYQLIIAAIIELSSSYRLVEHKTI